MLGCCSFVITGFCPQGYERVRRASEDDSSAATAYEDDEEEGLDEITSRDALPKEVRETHCMKDILGDVSMREWINKVPVCDSWGNNVSLPFVSVINYFFQIKIINKLKTSKSPTVAQVLSR